MKEDVRREVIMQDMLAKNLYANYMGMGAQNLIGATSMGNIFQKSSSI